MKLIEFLNPSPHTIQLVGPDRKTINIPKHAKVILSDWFIRYSPGYIKVVRVIGESGAAPLAIHRAPPQRLPPTNIKVTPKQPSPPAAPITRAPKKKPEGQVLKRPIVGHVVSGNPTAHFHQAVAEVYYPISNNIGVGILSYNRLPSLQRLIESIRANTDLKRTTIFVSDESTDHTVKTWLNAQKDIVVLDNPSRLGVAGNSNRLLRCLSRFKYKMLLNDDVVVLRPGWDKFYFDAMHSSGMHHYCYRQAGVYGATASDHTMSSWGGYAIKTIKDKPQGSIMAFDQKAFETAGYFDERFGLYGMEHVDWSRRVSTSGIQGEGYHDVAGSEIYFAISKDVSAVEDRGTHLTNARQLYTNISQEPGRVYVNPTPNSQVPSISYIIPCRNICGRNESIATIVASIRAQRFPNIEIVVAEEDSATRVNINEIYPAKYVLSQCPSDRPFCKAAAFNIGVKNSTTDYVILHDADIMVPAGYTAEMFRLLQTYNACHIGKQVLYMSRTSTSAINSQYFVDPSRECERVVDYFEGGSLGVRKSAYIGAGGFDEAFVGYGVEDCEFFERMAAYGNFYNQRSAKMVHLWHDRSGDWETSHRNNKTYMASVKHLSFAARSQELSAVWIRKYGQQ